MHFPFTIYNYFYKLLTCHWPNRGHGFPYATPPSAHTFVSGVTSPFNASIIYISISKIDFSMQNWSIRRTITTMWYPVNCTNHLSISDTWPTQTFTVFTGYKIVHIVDSEIKALPTFLRIIISSAPKLESKNEPLKWKGRWNNFMLKFKTNLLELFFILKKKRKNWNSVFCLLVLIKPDRLRARNSFEKQCRSKPFRYRGA